MSKPRRIEPIDCPAFAFGVDLNVVAKSLCPRLSGANAGLVDLLFNIDWLKRRAEAAAAIVAEKKLIPWHERKVSRKFEPAPCGARVVEVDELDLAKEALTLKREQVELVTAEFREFCESAMSRGDSDAFLQVAAIVQALKDRPLSFLILQAWMHGHGESTAGEIRERVNAWLAEDGRRSEAIQPGNEKTVTNNLEALGLPYRAGKNKKTGN